MSLRERYQKHAGHVLLVAEGCPCTVAAQGTTCHERHVAVHAQPPWLLGPALLRSPWPLQGQTGGLWVECHRSAQTIPTQPGTPSCLIVMMSWNFPQEITLSTTQMVLCVSGQTESSLGGNSKRNAEQLLGTRESGADHQATRLSDRVVYL